MALVGRAPSGRREPTRSAHSRRRVAGLGDALSDFVLGRGGVHLHEVLAERNLDPRLGVFGLHRLGDPCWRNGRTSCRERCCICRRACEGADEEDDMRRENVR